MKKSSQQIRTRLYLVMASLVVLPALVTMQVLRLVTLEGGELRSEGLEQAQAQRTIPALRGSILDRNGRLLVVNTARYELAADPGTTGFAGSAERLYRILGRLKGMSAGHYRRLVKGRKSPRYVLLERSLTEEQKERLEAEGIPGLILTPRFARRYNYGRLAAHVLGHVDVDFRGLAGVEQSYDAFLRGTDGRRMLQRDRRGVVRAYVGGRVVEPKHGNHIVLTLDLVRQAIAEEELARGVEETGAKWGTVIAVDTRDGAVLAMANMPNYDPNTPGRFSEAARRNHGLTDRIEPGSTFKLVTAVAAMEAGGVRLTDLIDTGRGVATFGGRTMRDTHPLGTVPFSKVIIESSNIGAAKAGTRVKPAAFYRIARSFGFGQQTWIDLPGEVAGSLKKPSQWSKITQAWMSHGYELEATPLQLLTAYAALANGGLLVQPYVVAERRSVLGETLWRARPDSVRRIFSRETALALRPVFQAVVDSGTAKLAQIPGLAVAGKTGTAKKAPYTSPAYRATFVGFFPADDPQVAMIVVLDEPKSSAYGGIASAPVFRRIAERWISTLPEVATRMAPPDTLPEASSLPTPDVRSMPSSVASADLRALGFRVKGEDRRNPFVTVKTQSPAPGEPTRGTVRFELADPSVPPPDLMPDVGGLSARDAVAWLSARGIKVRVRGLGAVADQWPNAGEPAPTVAELICR